MYFIILCIQHIGKLAHKTSVLEFDKPRYWSTVNALQKYLLLQFTTLLKYYSIMYVIIIVYKHQQ